MRGTLAERLWKKVVKRGSADCWRYKGYTDKYGYGKIWKEKGKPPITVNHATYLVTQGEVPEGMVVLTCPLMQECCNPEHVGLGTPSDVADRILWRKRQKRRGIIERQPYWLSDESIREIRATPKTTTHYELACKFRVSEAYISMIRNYKRRRNVPQCLPSNSQENPSTEESSEPSTIGTTSG